jgi:hypothetical protein
VQAVEDKVAGAVHAVGDTVQASRLHATGRMHKLKAASAAAMFAMER